jgi:hypothetical protein
MVALGVMSTLLHVYGATCLRVHWLYIGGLVGGFSGGIVFLTGPARPPGNDRSRREFRFGTTQTVQSDTDFAQLGLARGHTSQTITHFSFRPRSKPPALRSKGSSPRAGCCGDGRVQAKEPLGMGYQVPRDLGDEVLVQAAAG